MDRKGCSEVEVASLPGVITGDDITNFNTCLTLNNDNTGIVGNPIFSIRLNNDIIVSEIISRLPVKSLMRFKCVSKHWLYMIEEDSYFIDLHLTRSKARPSLVYLIPLKDQQHSEIRCMGHDDVVLTADLYLEGIGRADIHTMREHKVLCMRYIIVGEVPNCLEEDGDDGFEVIEVCEILTLGDGSWRRIPEVPPYLRDSLPCAYVNGSIYWCTDMFIKRENWSNPSCIVAFDFGTEKFRDIQIPEFIQDQPLDPDKSFKGYIRLVELGSRLGILRRISAFISKLWIFDDQRYGNEKVDKTKSASSEIWIEETITLPFPWTRTLSLNVYPVVGTHQMILQTYQCADRYMNNVSLYSYH
ncbi:hypothetical protein MKW98_030087 [Papaver atlanticum]|uniref:F-box domain-containing protein n=1 Tax=Papaver atlanticum TaxID=357466 RepID=A0AAD4T792_9MAGN|nr:hypothetical protein MKW98_030087 [Papaver atlanticum]